MDKKVYIIIIIIINAIYSMWQTELFWYSRILGLQQFHDRLIFILHNIFQIYLINCAPAKKIMDD